MRIAISRLGSAPNGGRPTRRIARSCTGEVSRISEKSIPRRRRVGRALFAARAARADDANPLAIVSPPHGIGNDEHAPRHRTAQSQESRSEEHTSELQSPCNLVCRLLLEKK